MSRNEVVFVGIALVVLWILALVFGSWLGRASVGVATTAFLIRLWVDSQRERPGQTD